MFFIQPTELKTWQMHGAFQINAFRNITFSNGSLNKTENPFSLQDDEKIDMTTYPKLNY